MKQFYTAVCLFLLTIAADAQIINIPDANFKNALVNTNCVEFSPNSEFEPAPNTDADTNNDGEIDVAEALAIPNLSLGAQNIASLAGIEHFTNLKVLLCDGNALTTLDVSMLPNLKRLSCMDNQLTILQIDQQAGSYWYGLTCTNNQLTSLDLGNNSFDWLYLNMNQISSLDISEVPQMYETNFANNQFTSFIIPSGITIGYLDLSNNPLTSFSAPQPISLEYFTCSNTLLESLDLSNVSTYVMLTVTENPNLQSLNLKNGHFEGGNDFWMSLNGNSSLQYVCIDDYEYEESFPDYYYISEYNSVRAALADDSVSISTSCSFASDGSHQTVVGNVHYNCNGVNMALPNLRLDVNDEPTYTDAQGNYFFFYGNDVIVSPNLTNLPYFSTTPANYSFTMANDDLETGNFCLSANGVFPDLETAIFPVGPARPGFDAHYKIVFENKGTETQSGTVSLVFEDDYTDFVTATPPVDSQSNGILSWNFAALAPFERREIAFTLNVNSPTETPPFNINDPLYFTVSVAAAETDATPNDNTYDWQQIAVGSYDPNDKAVSREVIDIAQLNDYLYYTIQFQNTGNFPAENVMISDQISDNLDSSTLQVISASHPYELRRMADRIEVVCNGIDLPPSASDEPASHGYVTFKVKPKSLLPIFTQIHNTAKIYFDYNAPIMTNEVTTTVTALGINAIDTIEFTLFPNPAGRNVTVALQNDSAVQSIQIYNLLGQQLQNVTPAFENREMTIDVSGLESGTYLLQIKTNKGKTSKKLIKS